MDNFNKGDDGYDPNFSIDNSNSEKLDMYGVWLKQRKDMIEPDSSEDAELFGEDDSDDAMHFDDDFSFSDSFSDIDDMDNTNSEVPELDELKIEDDTEPEVIPLESSSSYSSGSDTSDIALDEESFESLDLDDFLNDDSPAEPDHKEDAEPAEEEPIDIDFADHAEEAPAAKNDEPPAGLENFSEISLEDFEDADRGDGDFETVEEFDDVLVDSDSGERPNTEKRSDSPAIDLSVTVDDDANKLQSLTDASSQVVENNADIPIFGGEEKKSDTDTATSDFFDDVEAVQQDLLSPQHSGEHAEPVNTAAAPESPGHSAVANDKATELLMKIAHEISDLRAELNSLKAGFAVHTHAAAAEKPAVQDEAAAETESSGFFSDDDTDETIALTGDELNNILITADFTEEKNAEDAAAEPASEDYDIPPVLTKDIVPEIDAADEDSVTSDAEFEASITEPTQGDTADAAVAEGEKVLASDPVFNVEAAPITSLPEDLSYLDDEPSADSADAEVPEGVVVSGQDTPPAKETPKADEEEAFLKEDSNIESFDIPPEQEIILPEAGDEEVLTDDAETVPTIHELQKDEDFANPFEDAEHIPELEIEDELIEEPFVADPIIPSQILEETKVEEPPEEADELSELEEDSEEPELEVAKQETLLQAATRKREQTVSMPLELKNEIKSVLAYMDQLLEALPEQKIEEFAKSEYFETYKHLFEELGIS